MRVPLSWLKDYVDIQMTAEELANMLTMAGLEVETIDYIGKDWGDKVVTAQITQLEKVAGSDHLNYTHIDTGSQQLNVICGAPNIKQGDKVPLALPGAHLGDVVIGETKKFGYVSQGMLCSPRELGIGYDHSGIYILEDDTPLGVKLVDVLGEVVLDFSIKAHRGDLNAVIGIAREVAALTRQPLRIPQTTFQERGQATDTLMRVTVEDHELCPRYTARVISDLKIAPSPAWMSQRLLAAGLRPINNVVDITNYVMLEFGQPLHGFDYEKVPDHHIIVRHARAGETITTLDDVKRTLTPDMLLIADATGPTAIAGVMGGAKSEIDEQTTTVLLESANFKGSSVRRTSTALGLRTDASSHFEKGLDADLTLAGVNRAAQLMHDLAGATVHPGTVDIYPYPVRPRTMTFSPSAVEWLTAVRVNADEVAEILRALHFGVEINAVNSTLLVTIPSYRSDIEEDADLVEEVIRVLGYEHIPSTIPSGPLPEPTIDRWFEREKTVRTLLAGAGLNEIITYSLTSRARTLNLLPEVNESSVRVFLQSPYLAAAQEEASLEAADLNLSSAPFDPRALPAVTLANALNSDLDILRLTLMNSLMETLQSNSKHNQAGLRFFEVGRRYLPSERVEDLPDERRTVGIGLSGPAAISWIPELARPADFYDLKGMIETLLGALKITRYRFTAVHHPTFHPGRCALLELLVPSADGSERYVSAGILGEVHPLVQQRYDLAHRVYLSEIDLAQLYAAVPAQITYQPVSRHQELTRDLALVIDQHVSAQAVQDDILRHGGDLLRSVQLFDVYTGDPIPVGKKNLTYSLVYQASDRTLKDGEANALQDRIVEILHEDFGAVLR